ncbi:MAG: hypothetical protein JWO10_723 [Microbacteriaceae bacterium]|nr:hypothetical protein [Microbacteriaceae bacterium]
MVTQGHDAASQLVTPVSASGEVERSAKVGDRYLLGGEFVVDRALERPEVAFLDLDDLGVSHNPDRGESLQRLAVGVAHLWRVVDEPVTGLEVCETRAFAVIDAGDAQRHTALHVRAGDHSEPCVHADSLPQGTDVAAPASRAPPARARDERTRGILDETSKL